MAKNSRKTWWLLPIPLALGLLGAAIWWFARPDQANDPDDVPIKRLTANEVRALLDQKTFGLGQLENAQFEESFATFAAIEEKLPRERLPVQNRLLGLLWALGFEDSYINKPKDPVELAANRATALDQAAASLAKLRELTNDQALLHYLAARLALRRDDTTAAVEQLKQAAAADPNNPIYPATIYKILSQTGEPATEEEAQQALEAAWRLRPENLYLLAKMVNAQGRARDPQLVETLEVMRRAYAPFFGTVQDMAPALGEMGAVIDDAIAAVREENWGRALGLAARLHNASASLPARQFDEWRLDPHELEFVVYDFSPEFYAAADVPPPPAPEAIPVKLSAAPEAWRFPAETADATSARLADFDLDGRWDVILVRPQRIEVYGRKADDPSWSLLAAIDLPEGFAGVLPADLDRDHRENRPLATSLQSQGPSEAAIAEPPKCLLADVDLIAYGPSGVLVLKNVYDAQTNSRSLEKVEDDQQLSVVKNVLTAAVADVDHDGDLDLILSGEEGVSLWSNRENFTFENITQYSQPSPAGFRAITIIPVDWDRDVYLDLVLADASGAAGLWKNYGHRNFRWEPLSRSRLPGGTSVETPAPSQQEGPVRQTGPTAQILDADGNVAWDVLTAGPQGIALVANANPRAGVVQAIKTTQVTETPSAGLITWDYDNDGYLDIFSSSDGGAVTLRGLPDGSFQKVDGVLADPPSGIRNAHPADLDHDGDMDLLLETSTGPNVYLNEGGDANHSLSLSLGAEGEAQQPRERVNMHAIGSLLELKAGPLYQPRVADRQIIHFGLGNKEIADLVRLLWTNGIPQNVINPTTGEMICIDQRLKGSCPYVYTWDGSKWVFFTDSLWSAPIGLQFARGMLAPSREWEYLTLPGELLPEQDGHYRLMTTEELWEAAYLDEIRLIAVDHPADVEIYSNEKVGPAEIAEFRIHTVRNPRSPVAACNHRGRDVLELLARGDKKFVQLFDSVRRQGLVEPHYLELDLGELDNPQQITLFLSGWTWPTDTSINVAIDENPELSPPRPPSLWVPNEQGEWIEAIAYMGFPGGKTKTIAVDISDVFPSDDYRVRIQTSMEIYWDAAFFSVDEQAAPTRQQEAPLMSAELYYRGFSQRGEREHLGPETYDATQVDPSPHWPPMLGRFTRYGDATDLIRKRDDRLAVFAAGDALEMVFQKPKHDPPPGWKRGFLLYNVGWDKDADLNTVAGQTVEPLPFNGMPGYPLPPDQPEPNAPELRTYRETYQTREQSRAAFWRYVREYDATRPE